MNIKTFVVHLNHNGIKSTEREVSQYMKDDNVFFYFDGKTSLLASHKLDTLTIYSLVKKEPKTTYFEQLYAWMDTINIEKIKYMYNKRHTETNTKHVSFFVNRVLF